MQTENTHFLQLLHNAIDSVDSHFDCPETFTQDACGALAMALLQFSMQHSASPGLRIGVIFRIERNCDDDEELDTTFSHAMLATEDDTFDIHGNDAENRWYAHVEMMECTPDTYNDTEYKEYSLEEAVALFSEWGVSMNHYDTLCSLLGVNSIDVFSRTKRTA